LRNIRIDLQYDGTNYAGWQIQKNGISVQEKIEKALALLTNEKIHITGSGRTDAGVHAFHQVASFKTNSNIPENKFHLALNSKLPDDIRIIKAIEVDDSFNARYSATKRIYKYVISDTEILSPFDRYYSWHRRKKLSDETLSYILKKIIGTYDFTNLCSIDDESKSKIRTIHNIDVIRENGKLCIYISADAFLRKMVRMIIGTAVQSIEQCLGDDLLYNILISKERSKQVFSAKPQGLFLYKVEY